jgi:conjugative relaxase-like TrwC/TraI family protein
VLTLRALAAGDSGGYYLQSLPDGPTAYYLDGPLAGRWLGAGAVRLALAGPVRAEAFERVLAGADPGSGAMLVAGRAGFSGRTPGYDLTFSAPKSVTLLAVLSPPAVGEQVREAHRQAVADTMALVEVEVAAVRRGDGGTRQLPAEVVAAGFEHHSSRAVDPQLHTHVVVANVGWGADGRWSALHGQRLYGWAKTAGTVYQAALRAELTERLGVTWGPLRNGTAEITGFTRDQLDAFSTRHAEIRAELDRVGQTSARAAQLAAWATRDPKVDLPDAVLVARWQARAADVGVTAEMLDDVTVARRRPGPAPQPDMLAERLLGPEGLTAHASAFDRRHVLQAVANSHPAGLTVAGTVAAADQMIGDRRTVALAEPTRLGDRRYSTVELLATEAQLLERAARRRGAGVAVASPDALAAALARRPTLAGEQRRMVETLTRSGGGVQCVVGVAGAGKTFALDAARDAWQSSGVTVIGAALAARAAAELQAGAGIASTTLDRLLMDAEKPGPSGGLAWRAVVVVDEAGMVGTRKLARLLTMAERSQTAVVLVGDPRQLPEIDAGGAFAALTKVVPSVELVDNRRQSQAWERAALGELRAGDVQVAVAAYRDQGRVTLVGDADSARERLVDDWWAARQDGNQVAMYALRRGDVDDLNRRARLRMAKNGLLAGEPLLIGERRFAVGDEVMALRNDRRLGIRNGTRGTVVAVDHDTRSLSVQAAEATVVLPGEYLDGSHLGYGYASTVHKAQGATVDRAFVLGSDSLYREAGYVALSRARTRTDLYLVAAPPHHRRDDRALDPIAQLAAALSRSQAQQLATPETDHDQIRTLVELEDERDRLRRQLGPPPPAPTGDAARDYAAAVQAREDAQRLLDTVDRLPRRQRAAARAAAELDLGDASARQWRAGETLAVDNDTRVVWEHWLADNTAPLARYHQLSGDIDQRRQALEAAALADPAPHHLVGLGPPPPSGAGRDRWAEAAAAVDTYRDRCQVTGPDPLGPAPDTADAARHHRAAQHSLDTARRALGLDRGHERGMEL